MKRIKTKYPGVFYREVDRLGGIGTEKVYYILFKKDGKLLEEKAGRQYADDMTPARAAAYRAERIEGKRKSRKEIREEKEAAKKAEQDKWTIAKLWTEYKRQNPDLKGLKTDENRFVNHIEPTFGKKEVKEIIPLDVDRLRLSMLKERAPATVRNTLELLRRIINFGVKKQLCEGLSFTIELPKLDNLQTEDLTPDQLFSLLKALDESKDVQAANFMRMALFTGMRRGELFRLQWGHVDFERKFISLRNTKSGKDQMIPMSAAVKEILESHPKTESPFIFPGRHGKQRTDIKKSVNRIKKEAGLPEDFRPLHGLRHSFASMLANSQKVTMYVLQQLLTHKSPGMTARYSHLRDGVLREASDLAGDIINQARGEMNNQVAINSTDTESRGQSDGKKK